MLDGDRLKTAETIALLRGRIDLRPVRGTSLVSIRVYSDTPDEAARIANAIAEAYRAHRQEQRLQMSRGGIKALEERFRKQEEEVKKAQELVDKLREDLHISYQMAGEEGPRPLMTADTLRKLESLRIESKAEYVRQATLLERLRSLGKDLGPEGLAQAIPTVAQDAVLSAFLEHLGTADQQLVSLTKEYGPQHLEVLKVKSQIEDLHSKIKSRVDGIMLGMEARVLSLSNSLENLEKEVAVATTNDVVRANETRPYFEAKRNLEELQRFRQILDTKIASEKIEVELPKMPPVDLVDRAVPALRPVSPNLPRALALIVFGVLLVIAGLLMLAGRPGTGPNPRPA